ncbi:MAG: adenylosuccinate synthetase [Candidatus Aenigmarchaeota archaeon]|nr:adenylosuccinate synthetase [Candidatus Aenigmarchaeota archaeon]
MSSVALFGVQWGDEGKAKIIDTIGQNPEYFFGNDYPLVVARYMGGPNAGHTQYVDDKEVIFHGVPSGLTITGAYNVDLPGFIADPKLMVEEIEHLRGLGFPVTPENLGICGNVHMILEHHYWLEEKEIERSGGKIAPTRRAIFPTYVDTASRRGMNFAEFSDKDTFSYLLEEALKRVSWEVGESTRNGDTETRTRKPIDKAEYMEQYDAAREFLAPFIVSEGAVRAAHADDNWIYEAQGGVMLDPVRGRRPDVTSSSALLLPANATRWGVSKALMSRVGADSPPTRMGEELEMKARGKKGTPGAEFGATSGRPRKVSWFDGPVVRYALRVGGVDKLALTKLDVLPKVGDEVFLCDYYLDGEKRLYEPPADQTRWDRLKPHYIKVKGFPGVDISGARDWDDLPQEAKDYKKAVEDVVEFDISLLSVGPRGDQSILL